MSGVFCTLCPDDMYKQYETSSCVSCDNVTYSLAVPLLLAVVLLIASGLCFAHAASSAGKEAVKKLQRWSKRALFGHGYDVDQAALRARASLPPPPHFPQPRPLASAPRPLHPLLSPSSARSFCWVLSTVPDVSGAGAARRHPHHRLHYIDPALGLGHVLVPSPLPAPLRRPHASPPTPFPPHPKITHTPAPTPARTFARAPPRPPSSAAPQAAGLGGFLPSLIFWAIAPIIGCVISVAAALGLKLKPEGAKWVKDGLLDALQPVLIIMFIAYTPAASLAMRAYDCQELPHELGSVAPESVSGDRYLRHDYLIECGDVGDDR